MKIIFYIIFPVAILLSVLICFQPAAGTEENQDGMSAQYARLVDELIVNSEKKGAFRNTESENMREDVRLSLMKASFYKKNRNQLIRELAEAGVAAKPHTVQHFLNQRFFAIVRENDATVAEAYSPPDTDF